MTTGLKRERSVEVLFSGGMDSAALLGLYLREQFAVRPLFVDFGQPAAEQESHAAEAVCKYYGLNLSTMTVRSGVSFSSGEITGRNAFLLFAAVLVGGARSGTVSIGIHAGSPYYDCCENFVNDMQTILDGYTAGRLKVSAPFLTWSKQGIWEFCKETQVPVKSTYSCEKGGMSPCGKCLSCGDREMLLAL